MTSTAGAKSWRIWLLDFKSLNPEWTKKRLGQTKLSPTIGSGVLFIISDAAMVCKENCHRMYKDFLIVLGLLRFIKGCLIVFEREKFQYIRLQGF